MGPRSVSVLLALAAFASAATAWCLLTQPVWASAIVVISEAATWCWWLSAEGDQSPIR